jgi:hypothetical protein
VAERPGTEYAPCLLEMKEGIRTKEKKEKKEKKSKEKEKEQKIDVSFRFSNAGKNNCEPQFIE